MLTEAEQAGGARLFPRWLSPAAQTELGREVWDICEAAGWVQPTTRRGQSFSVRQMNLGPLGWISDRRGYRYEPHHPVSGQPWPGMPPALWALWDAVVPNQPPPEAALVNHYGGTARMGLHRDEDEAATDCPVVGLSLGQAAMFRLGGPTRQAKSRSFRIESGDVLVLGGEARHWFHGVDRVVEGPDLFGEAFPFPGRLSITLRRVSAETRLRRT